MCGLTTAVTFADDPSLVVLQYVDLDAPVGNAYTYMNPSNVITFSSPGDSCPLISNQIEGMTSNTTITASFPTGCVQPCTQIDLSATNEPS